MSKTKYNTTRLRGSKLHSFEKKYKGRRTTLKLIPGEVIVRHIGSVEVRAKTFKLVVTNYQLYFDGEEPHTSISVPLVSLLKIKRVKDQDFRFLIELRCKDLSSISCWIWEQHVHIRNDIMNLLTAAAYPNTFRSLFCFNYGASFPKEIFKFNGWSLYNPIEEYIRMGIPTEECSKSLWRISNANAEYHLCPTYPKQLVVPSSFSDDRLVEVSKFRSRGRLPVLTWLHPTNGASLVRCSQPLRGLRSNHSKDDEALFEAIRKTNCNSKDTLIILDTRPKLNARANSLKGAGFEQISRYNECELIFHGIPNIHVMRDALKQLQERTKDTPGSDEESLVASLLDSDWLKYSRKLLKVSLLLARMLNDEGVSVVTHCSDGWDRTSQACALAQLMLDPYYRTMRGFAVLVEKDWLSFGHKIAERHGHGKNLANYKDKNRSPIFLQFIDCVWQLVLQFPNYFEFNADFLYVLATQAYNCLSGTFLCCSEREREEEMLHTKTISVWNLINCYASGFINIKYEKREEMLCPNISRGHVFMWRKLYLKWFLLLQGDLSVPFPSIEAPRRPTYNYFGDVVNPIAAAKASRTKQKKKRKKKREKRKDKKNTKTSRQFYPLSPSSNATTLKMKKEVPLKREKQKKNNTKTSGSSKKLRTSISLQNIRKGQMVSPSPSSSDGLIVSCSPSSSDAGTPQTKGLNRTPKKRRGKRTKKSEAASLSSLTTTNNKNGTTSSVSGDIQKRESSTPESGEENKTVTRMENTTTTTANIGSSTTIVLTKGITQRPKKVVVTVIMESDKG